MQSILERASIPETLAEWVMILVKSESIRLQVLNL